jgi:hypothetical protein
VITQIFFDCIDADGGKWTAVIDHNAGGRTFYNLRGGGAVGKPVRHARRMSTLSAPEAARDSSRPDGVTAHPACVVSRKVICVQDSD